jgi:hypothetical protein
MISNPSEFKQAESMIKSYSNKRSTVSRNVLSPPNLTNLETITSAQSTRVLDSQASSSKNVEPGPKRSLTKQKAPVTTTNVSAVDLFLTACGVPGTKYEHTK